jgi:hypothetical protein
MAVKANYTDSLKNYLRLDPNVKGEVLRELHGHLEDKSHELVESGLSKKEATATAERLLGSPRLIAQQMYEVYSQGSWRQALFAALPHLLVGALFALHSWLNGLWILGAIGAIIGTVLYGWCRGKPTWLFPWLGYCLTPVIAVGILLVYLPGNWTWFAMTAYIPLALLIIFSVTKQTIKKDWVFASLMLLPIPIVLGWILALEIEDQITWLRQLNELAPLIALSFAVLAITVAAFIRFRQRWAKVGSLLLLETVALVIIAMGGRSNIGLVGWLLVAVLTLLLLLGPALLERKLRQNSPESLKQPGKHARSLVRTKPES